MHEKHCKYIVVALLALSVAASGCLNAELNTKLNKDFSGTKSIHLEMAQLLYTSTIQSKISRENLSRVEGAELVSYKEEVKNGKVILDVTVKYKDMRILEGLNISEKDAVIRYDDSTFEELGEIGQVPGTAADTFSIKYTLEMPYKIESSNADTVDGNKATWVISDLKSKPIHAESKVPTAPGFTAAGLLVAGLLAIAFRWNRR